MKRLKYLWILFAVLLVASCSKDDGFAPGTDDTSGGELQEYTFTVDVDYTLTGDDETAASTAKNIGTRATATTDDTPTRCFMEVFDVANWETPNLPGVQQGVKNADGSFTFTARLVEKNRYKFCFWADNGDGEITSLKAVPYTIGTVAFAATLECRITEVTGVTLKHVVTKVTLATTATTTITAGEEATLATQCATEYNALLGTVTQSGEQTYKSSTSGDYDANANVVSCYVIPTAEQQDITIGCHLLEQTIADVPFTVNTHVTLQGDLSEENENWKTTDEYIVSRFMDYLFKDGIPLGNADNTNFYNLNGTKEDVNNLFQKITRNPGFSVDGVDRQWVIGSSFEDAHYLYAYDSNEGNTGIAWHRDSKSFNWIITNNSSYPTFPTVY